MTFSRINRGGALLLLGLFLIDLTIRAATWSWLEASRKQYVEKASVQTIDMT